MQCLIGKKVRVLYSDVESAYAHVGTVSAVEAHMVFLTGVTQFGTPKGDYAVNTLNQNFLRFDIEDREEPDCHEILRKAWANSD